MKKARGALRRILPWAAVVVALAIAGLPALAAGASQAPDFTLTDIYGNPLRLSDFRGKIVLLDFMYEKCASCEIARPVLVDVYNAHRGVFDGISIDIFTSVDTDASLRAYTQSPDTFIPWHVARDTAAVQTQYNVDAVVYLFLVDQNGYVIYTKQGMSLGSETALRDELEAKIALALQGTAPPIDLQQVSIFALAAIAGVASFFSPCSFPMLPGYMAFFLTLDSKDAARMSKRRAVLSGTLSSLGIILVYGIIAGVLVLIGAAAVAVIPPLQAIVGGLLILMGIVMFTAIQYNWLVNPFRALRHRIFPKWTPNAATTVQGKLFSYGVGYGAAGFGCVAPPFIAAILNATVIGGPAAGAMVLGVYAGVVIGLMAAITLTLATVGQAAVKKMNRYTEVIKKVSAAVLIVAGAYLIYYWYSAWVA